MGITNKPEVDNSANLQLQEELAKQRQEQQQQLDEAQKRRKDLLRRQLDGSGSLISDQQTGTTLGG